MPVGRYSTRSGTKWCQVGSSPITSGPSPGTTQPTSRPNVRGIARPQPQPRRQGNPNGVHRRVPALGGRQGTSRRPREVPRPARWRGLHGPLARRLPGDLPQGRLRGAGRQGRRPADRRCQRPHVQPGAVRQRLRGRARPAGPGRPAGRRCARSLGLAGDAVVVGARDHAEIWAPAAGTTTAGRWRRPRRSPRTSPASGSEGSEHRAAAAPPHALPGSARDRQGTGGRDEGRAPSGAGGGGHDDTRARARQPSDRRHARRRWAHRADPGSRQS